MHYHLDYQKSSGSLSHKTIGWLCLGVFVAMLSVVWIPYGRAVLNASAFTFLPPDWAAHYVNATLPTVGEALTTNQLIIKTNNPYIKAPIVEGIEPADLLKGVGRDPESVVPGAQGRVVLSGHRFWPDPSSPWSTVFFSLDRLNIGDTITVSYNQRQYTYKVTESWNIAKQQVKPYLAPTTKRLLTIYTCGPTAYLSRNRLGFTAVLDESNDRQEANKALDAFQGGVL